MFTDERFGCATIPKVRDEIFRTQKFKTKYTWRDDYRESIRSLGISSIETDEFNLNLSAINSLIDTGVENSKTGLLIDLSQTDKHIIACAASNGYDIASVDKNLVDFAEQQFEVKNITPLALVNQWLEDGLITWNDQLQMIMEDWDKCGEMKQPISEIGRFQTLTRYRYAGT
ncbi:MAG: hypothetical protein ACYCYR_10335 [Desulfobulbaceae bacterium]